MHITTQRVIIILQKSLLAPWTKRNYLITNILFVNFKKRHQFFELMDPI
jgi:hypothetical protein